MKYKNGKNKMVKMVKAEHKNSIVVMLTLALLCQQLFVVVNCQEDEAESATESETTQSPETETTTDSNIETTTSVPPPIIETVPKL